jgi:hypothetical protein
MPQLELSASMARVRTDSSQVSGEAGETLALLCSVQFPYQASSEHALTNIRVQHPSLLEKSTIYVIDSCLHGYHAMLVIQCFQMQSESTSSTVSPLFYSHSLAPTPE